MKTILISMLALGLALPACGGDEIDDEAKQKPLLTAPKPAAGKADATEHVSEDGGPCGFINRVAYRCASGLVCWPGGEEPDLGICGQPF